MNLSFFSASNIKRNIFNHINFKVLGVLILLCFIAGITITFVLDLRSNSDISNFGVSLFFLIVAFFLLRSKIKFNNYCPNCRNNRCFYGDVNTKRTHYSSSSSDVIYEREGGKRVGYFQEGTTIDGAKYEIRNETSTSKTNFYDWDCLNCGHKDNLEESKAHLYYILAILISLYGTFHYGFYPLGNEIYKQYEYKQQEKKLQLRNKSGATTRDSISTSDSVTPIDTVATQAYEFNEADFAARYYIGPLQKIEAQFVGYEEGDLVHYIFTDEDGNSHGFSAIPSKYKLVVESPESDYGVTPNKKYLNKTFSITWKSFTPKFNEEMEYPFEGVISIELLD